MESFVTRTRGVVWRGGRSLPAETMTRELGEKIVSSSPKGAIYDLVVRGNVLIN